VCGCRVGGVPWTMVGPVCGVDSFDYYSCCVALCGFLTGLTKRDLKVLGVADDLEERM
jgi:hypothetical protein